MAQRPLTCWDCVLIPPGTWIFLCCECCILSGRVLCVGSNARPEKYTRILKLVFSCFNTISSDRMLWIFSYKSLNYASGWDSIQHFRIFTRGKRKREVLCSLGCTHCREAFVAFLHTSLNIMSTYFNYKYDVTIFTGTA